MNIVLVDDDAFSRKLMGYYLAPLGGQVTLLASGQECLDQWTQVNPDVILMDCQMPGLDGFETVLRLRAAGYGGKIIALTGNSDDETVARCRQVGMDDHLGKPVTAEKLRATIEGTLHEPPAEEPEEDPLARVRQIAQSANNPALMGRLVSAFLRTTGELVEQLRLSSKAAEVAALAHRLRGSAGTFGAARLSQSAGQLEDSLRQSSLAECAQLRQEVLELWPPLKEKLVQAGGSA